MPIEITYPTDAELRELEPDFLAAETANDPIFSDFPIVDVNADVLMWETYDPVTGLQQVRGLNGQPGRVARVGAKSYVAAPGYYGEVVSVDERLLTQARPLGQWAGPINLDAEILRLQRQLVAREVALVRASIWTLLSSGVLSVLDKDGGIAFTDQFPIQSYSSSIAWTVQANATPLADFRAVQLLTRGSSCVIDQGARAYMNRATLNAMLSNTNANDLAGKRTSGLGTVLGMEDANRLLASEGLPQIVVNDDGYLDSTGTFHTYIPENTVVVVGRRLSGQKLGEYRRTRNANNPDMGPGPYVKVVDSLNTGTPVPRTIDVHRGHNGGPVIFYPNGVVVMHV